MNTGVRLGCFIEISQDEYRICGNKAIERAPSCICHVGMSREDVKTPGCCFPPEISHNAAWMHTARAPPAGTRNTRYTTLFVKQWSLRRRPTLHPTSPKSLL